MYWNPNVRSQKSKNNVETDNEREMRQKSQRGCEFKTHRKIEQRTKTKTKETPTLEDIYQWINEEILVHGLRDNKFRQYLLKK
jgi:hypothetical protein